MENPLRRYGGLGKLLSDGSYGTDVNDQATVKPQPTERTHGIRKVTTFKDNSLESLRCAAVKEFCQ